MCHHLHWVDFKHKSKSEHICLKIKSGSTYKKFQPTSSLVSMVEDGYMHIRTLEKGCNSSVCKHAECRVQHCSTLILCLELREWCHCSSGVSELLGWGHEGSTQPWIHRSSPPPPPHCRILNTLPFFSKCFPYGSFTHSPSSQQDWIQNLLSLNLKLNLIPFFFFKSRQNGKMFS